VTVASPLAQKLIPVYADASKGQLSLKVSPTPALPYVVAPASSTALTTSDPVTIIEYVPAYASASLGSTISVPFGGSSTISVGAPAAVDAYTYQYPTRLSWGMTALSGASASAATSRSSIIGAV